MKNSCKNTYCIIAFCIFFLSGCDSNDTNGIDNDNDQAVGSKERTNSSGLKTASAIISNTSFSLWQTCSTAPYLISGTNGICVPVGGTECSSNYVGAQQINGQYATGISFTGCFKGGSNAPDGSNEMAVFICDDITNWTGREMGFVMTLSDNSLKAYIQSPGQYIYRTISTGDSGYHDFKCQVRSANEASLVDFYVDGEYKCSLENPGVNYWNNWYYFVGTTHRTSDEWQSSGQQIEMYDIVTY